MAPKLILLLCFMGLSNLTGCASTTEQQETKNNTQIVAIQAEAEHAYKMAMLDQAESLYLQVLNSVPNYAPAWFRLGNIYTRTSRHEAAIEAYMRCLQLEPENQKAWYNISLVRLKQATQVLASAKRQGDGNTPVGRQINALLDALNDLQSNDRSPEPQEAQ